MSRWVAPITDRDASDVERAAAEPGAAQSLKGARNHTDLSRITGNMRYIRDTLRIHGYILPELISKTHWSVGEIPARSEIKKIRADVETLREAWVVFMSTPQTPELPYTHYEKMNRIERIIFDLGKTIEYMMAAFRFSNQFYSGECGDISKIRFAGRKKWSEIKNQTWVEIKSQTWVEQLKGGSQTGGKQYKI